MTYPSVTIGFTARERFNLAAKALKTLYKHTPIPFDLVIVNCNIPAKYLAEIKEVLKDRTNYKIIHTDSYLRGNQARNLVLDNATGEYIALLENDCSVSPGWLEKLIAACQKTGARAAIPLLLEDASRLNPHKVHHDTKLAGIKKTGGGYEFVEDLGIMERYKEKEIHEVASLEMHVMLLHCSTVQKIGKFDENIKADSTYAYVGLSMALTTNGIKIVCEPNAVVNFRNPPPVENDELQFYRFVWNPEYVLPTKEYLAGKWSILNMHDSTGFVADQYYRTNRFAWYVRKAPQKFARIFRTFLRK